MRYKFLIASKSCRMPDCRSSAIPFFAWHGRIKDLTGIRFVQKAGRGGLGRAQKQAGARGIDRLNTCNAIVIYAPRIQDFRLGMHFQALSTLCGSTRVIKVPVGTTVGYVPADISSFDNTIAHSDAGKQGVTTALAEDLNPVEEYQDDSDDLQTTATQQSDSDALEKRKLKRTIADLTAPNSSFIVAHGGRGGRGNAALRSTPNRYAPVLGLFWDAAYP